MASPWSGWHSHAVPQFYTHHFSQGHLVKSTRTRFKVHISCRLWGCWTPVELCDSISGLCSVKWGEEHFPDSSSFRVWLSIRGQKYCPLPLFLLKVAGLIPNFSVLSCATDICVHQKLFHRLCPGTEHSTSLSQLEGRGQRAQIRSSFHVKKELIWV